MLLLGLIWFILAIKFLQNFSYSIIEDHEVIEFLEQTFEQYHKEIYCEKYLDKDKSLMREKKEDFFIFFFFD